MSKGYHVQGVRVQRVHVQVDFVLLPLWIICGLMTHRYKY